MLERADEFNRIVGEELKAQPALPITRPDKGRNTIPRAGRCDHEQGRLFTGRYTSIELIECKDVKIVGAIAERITADDSEVIIENSRISGAAIALSATRSDILATNVTMSAETPISASRSHLDLAGVKLLGTRTAVASDDRSVFIFSICQAESPDHTGLLHGTRHGNAK